MSRTKRKSLKGDWPNASLFEEEVGDGQVDCFRPHLKMKPYSKEKRPMKFRASKTDHVTGFYKGVSNSDKLITRNANRSIKKAFRQQLKQEIQNELNEEI